MPSPEIEEFARLLVRKVRDAAIRSSDAVLQPKTDHAVAKRWREAGRNGDLKSIANVVIPDIVDDTIFHLLHAIDEGLLKLSFAASNGKQIDLYKDGELAGWYAGDDWPMNYSEERFIDDFSDLR